MLSKMWSGWAVSPLVYTTALRAAFHEWIGSYLQYSLPILGKTYFKVDLKELTELSP